MKKKREIYSAGVILFLFVAISVTAVKQNQENMHLTDTPLSDTKAAEEDMPWQDMPLYAGILAEFRRTEIAAVERNRELMVTSANGGMYGEGQIYSFLQGPKSWEEGRSWSGAWSGEYVNGNYFGNFGCGLCCMANIYSTMTNYECSPWDMYEYARQVSGYYPTKNTGAIGWADMKVTLRKSGFHTELCLKPESYEAFQSQIARAKTAVVLVCSRDDDAYWEKTGGHYVNIWMYNQQTDEVFLTDPGDPDRNRSWIPLRYVYDALKTASQYQYLLVNEYSEENNLWMQDTIDDAWIKP